VENWIQKFASLKERLSVLPEGNSPAYRYELGRFKGAVRRYFEGRYFDIPGYTWREVNPWRFFLLEAPEGFCLIERVLRNYNSWSPGQVSAALGLASSMAHSSDKVLADRARSILQYLLNDIGKPAICHSYQDYIFFHQYYFSLAQLDQKHNDICETFISNNGISDDNWELRINREYYESGDDSKTRQSLQKKLFEHNEILERDKYLVSVRQFQYEVVEKYGFMSGTFSESKSQEIKISVKEWIMGDKFEQVTNSIGDLHMGSKYNIYGGNQGVVGDNAEAHDFTQVLNQAFQQQTLAESAAEIQRLLKQLEQTNPSATKDEKVDFINDETTPGFKRRVVGALQAGGEVAIEEFLDNPYINIGKAIVKSWLRIG